MPRDDSPAGQRRQLGAAMRSFRKDAGIDREAAAELIEVTGPTLTRKERGESKFKRQEIEVLAKAYGIDGDGDELQMLIELAREARAGTKRGEFPMFVPLKNRAFLELERDDAVEILVVTMSLVPMYFQTDAYMRELWRRNGDLFSSQRIDELANVRKTRQQVVTKPGAPMIRVVMHEFALRLPVGGPALMHEQLLRLADACDLPNVEIQVQPIDAGSYPGIDSTFDVLRFRNGSASDMVRIHGRVESFYRDRKVATEPYRVLWDRRRVAALDLQASKALILDAAAHFGSRAGQATPKVGEMSR